MDTKVHNFNILGIAYIKIKNQAPYSFGGVVSTRLGIYYVNKWKIA